jgi:hypothetical protein
MKLIVTVDTEEDGWTDYGPEGIRATNIRQLPSLQSLLDKHGFRPVYLVTYRVASDQESVAILRGFLFGDACEIGAHLHPWNTPPIGPVVAPRDTMLCNLPAAQQAQKLAVLTDKLQHVFGQRPSAFRAGRYGYGPVTARALVEAGYRIDSSITPLLDWSPYEGPDFGEVKPRPYWKVGENVFDGVTPTPLIEIPLTVGYLGRNWSRQHALRRRLEQGPLRRWHLIGALSKLGLGRRVSLAPELETTDDMIALIERLASERWTLLNLSFHSPTLCPGLTPFVRTDAERRVFLDRLDAVLSFARSRGVEASTLREAATAIEAGASDA